ncbi:LysR family transcriptional regulator [Photobacterium sp. WH77]|uniref:LysR family transcriptional regulator n=1 Tax=unclassified Photobacterium TaxID=2628852 RepID=UPI001EDC4DCF|nr:MULTISPECIES: LysR family transcriptional regulator [unclassified Photobacterium]MCG2837531.1 LysR family transcriptional regulator [Photobacterium sp. WH77]MCG2845147.1 LysR family transcriptional regulator [Photobacterium sp. WH80]
MKAIDLNLIPALNVLLEERNVARAAKRMNLSQSAMSRTLARLRVTMDDPVLVRAGRHLVPSPRALEIQAQVSQLTMDVRAILTPAVPVNIASLARTFTLFASDGFVESLGGALVKRMTEEAPRSRVRFISQSSPQGAGLRDGSIDIEIGKLRETTYPELRVRRLFEDHFIGVVSAQHPFSQRQVTAEQYFSADHIGVTRMDADKSHLETLLNESGQRLNIRASVSSYTSAVTLASATALVATVPAKHTQSFRQGMHCFQLPFTVSPIPISMLWHPRMNADQAHGWLRKTIVDISHEL